MNAIAAAVAHMAAGAGIALAPSIRGDPRLRYSLARAQAGTEESEEAAPQ
jgi:hypothetical protein